MGTDLICPVCGKDDSKSLAGLRAHERSHNKPKMAGLVGGSVAHEVATPRTLRDLHLTSNTDDMAAIRGIKYISPDCRVFDNTHKQWVSGPCSQLEGAWWETCEHGGPTRAELSALGLPGYPAYYEASYKQLDDEEWVPETDLQGNPTGNLVATGKKDTRKIRSIKPRITEVSASIRNSGGILPMFAQVRGAKPPEEFGILPFCEFWQCYRQETKLYRNGRYCSENHAKLVAADQDGVVLALAYGTDGERIRRQQLGDIDVRREVAAV